MISKKTRSWMFVGLCVACALLGIAILSYALVGKAVYHQLSNTINVIIGIGWLVAAIFFGITAKTIRDPWGV